MIKYLSVLHNTLLLLFGLAIILVLFDMFHFAGALERASAAISPDALREAAPVLTRHFLIQGAALLLSVSALLVAFLRLREEQRNSVTAKREKLPEEGILNREPLQGINTAGDALAELRSMLEKTSDPQERNQKLLSAICKATGMGQALLYRSRSDGPRRMLEPEATFAFHLQEGSGLCYDFGEGLAGQAAKTGRSHYMDAVPEGYHRIVSGLGGASPCTILFVPVLRDGEVVALGEFGSFSAISPADRDLVEEALNYYTAHTAIPGKGKEKAGKRRTRLADVPAEDERLVQ